MFHLTMFLYMVFVFVKHKSFEKKLHKKICWWLFSIMFSLDRMANTFKDIKSQFSYRLFMFIFVCIQACIYLYLQRIILIYRKCVESWPQLFFLFSDLTLTLIMDILSVQKYIYGDSWMCIAFSVQ